MIHKIKCNSVCFQATLDKDKTFEIRSNDRHYQKGDSVIMEEFQIDGHKYTGRQLQFEIGFVTNYAQSEDYVVFSCLNIGPRNTDKIIDDEIPF